MRFLAQSATFAAIALAAAAAVAAPAPAGDRHVTYTLAPGVESAYRVFVPESWKAGDRWPLVVILHGGGGTEDTPFDRTPGFRERLEDAARSHRFILLSPRGHKGWWGADMMPPDATAPVVPGRYRMPPAGAITSPPPTLPPLSAEDRALASLDVDRSIAAIERDYGIDRSRLYLMGNSMGSVGTLHLAQVDARRWCAIAPSDGPVDPATFPFDRVKGLRAALFVHGDDDRVAPIESMRAIAAGFVRAGVPTRFVTVPGGSHSDSWQRALPDIFDFFAASDCRRAASPRR